MKPVIFILGLFGAVGVIGAFANLGTIVGGYTALGRLFSLLFGVAALVGAFGCYKRMKYGWYVVEILIWGSVLCAVARAAYVGWKIDLPWFGVVLGGLGEGVKIAIFSIALIPFWSRQRKNFGLPNHTAEPASPSRAGSP